MSYDDGHTSRITAETETKTRQRLKRNNIGAVTPNAKLLKDLVNIFTKYNLVPGKCTDLPRDTITFLDFFLSPDEGVDKHVCNCETTHFHDELFIFIISFHLENQTRKLY